MNTIDPRGTNDVEFDIVETIRPTATGGILVSFRFRYLVQPIVAQG